MHSTFDPRQAFAHEFTEASRRRLRKWLIIYLVVQLVLAAAVVITIAGLMLTIPSDQTELHVSIWSLPQTLTILVGLVIVARQANASIDRLLRIAFWVVLIEALTVVMGSYTGAMTMGTTDSVDVESSIGSLIAVHAIACLFLPWRPLQSLKPLWPALILEAGADLWARGLSPEAVGMAVAGAVLAPAPGLIIAFLKTRRFDRRFGHRMLVQSWQHTAAEMEQARAIMDTLLPAPVTRADISVQWKHVPAGAIGGDLVWIHGGGGSGEPLMIVVLDVTGHGIPAALAASRLHGDLTMLTLERPSSGPGDLLATINRTAYLLLSKRRVFGTAVAIEIDPARGTAVVASAGHPPLVHVRATGTSHVIEPTTTMLGVIDPDSFDAEPITLHLSPGDAIVACTDGAFERFDENGVLGGFDEYRRHAEAIDAIGSIDAPAALLERLDALQAGPADDDTVVLIAALPSS